MPHSYSAEHHDWDMTLRAAWSLVMIGQAAHYIPDQCGNLQVRQFSSYTGSMLLSFSAIESFSASLAFSMPRTDRFKDFDFDKYRRTSRFWNKLELICSAIPYELDKSQGLFQVISEMQQWRNLVTHATPHRIEPTDIPTTMHTTELHKPLRGKEYTRKVTMDNAKIFYKSAVEYVDLLQEQTGIKPRAMAQYVVGTDDV